MLSSEPPRLVLFDVADTLLVKPEVIPTISEILAEWGSPISQDVVADRHKLVSELTPAPPSTNREFYMGFNARLLTTLGIAAEQSLIDAIYRRCRTLPWDPAPDAAVVDRLPVPVGIVSNWDRGLSNVLASFFTREFDPVVSSTDAGVAKPDPQIFDIALDGIDVSRGDVLYVGDSPALDATAARRAGVRFVLVDRRGIFPGFDGDRVGSLGELDALFT